MSLFAQKSRPEMVATIYGSSQAQLSERLGIVTRCDARFTADVKKPRECEAKSWFCDDWLLSQRSPLPRARCSISSISNEIFNLDSLQK
jgi:hypothetical protein